MAYRARPERFRPVTVEERAAGLIARCPPCRRMSEERGTRFVGGQIVATGPPSAQAIVAAHVRWHGGA